MDALPIATPTSGDSAPDRCVTSSLEYAARVRELETLRAVHRGELARLLHDVRAYGTTTSDDDLLAVLEEAAIDRARESPSSRLSPSTRPSSMMTRPGSSAPRRSKSPTRPGRRRATA
jgi:hypothetical protein